MREAVALISGSSLAVICYSISGEGGRKRAKAAPQPSLSKQMRKTQVLTEVRVCSRFVEQQLKGRPEKMERENRRRPRYLSTKVGLPASLNA
jgi:hypothetical protein